MQSTILIVDDDVITQRIMETILSADDYRFVRAATGPEAIEAANRVMPDAILLDVMLPGMNGFEVCRQLRGSTLLAEVPIIMVTALQDRESRLEGIAAGADDFLSKPVDPDELTGRMRTVTRLNRYRQLRHERERYAALLDRLPDAVFCIDRAGTIRLANPALGDLVGVQPANGAVGRSVTDFLPPAEQARFRAWLAGQERASNPGAPLETRVRREDAVERVVELRASTVGLGDESEFQCVAHDVTERKRTDEMLRRRTDELEKTRQRLDALARRLLHAQEAERRHVARELHDELGQVMTAVRLQLLAVPQIADACQRNRALQSAVEAIDGALQWIRNLSVSLRPAVLDDLGLLPALRWFVDRQAAAAGLEAKVTGRLPEGKIPAEVEVIGFRIVQEAITNAIRHAKASHLTVDARLHDGRLELAVTDDGVGFSVADAMEHALAGQSLGLLGMQERVTLVQGTLAVESRQGAGTTVRASLPVGIPPRRRGRRLEKES